MKNSIFLLAMLTFIFSTTSFASFPVSEKLESNTTEVSFPVTETKSNSDSISDSIKNYASNVEWGAFFAGLLLGLIGVLLIAIFGGDTSSAWKGFGVWLILLLLVGLGGA